MARIDANTLAAVRRILASGNTHVTYTKPEVNSAIQAMEDWFETQGPEIEQAMLDAVGKSIFTGDLMAKTIVGWCHYRIAFEPKVPKGEGALAVGGTDTSFIGRVRTFLRLN